MFTSTHKNAAPGAGVTMLLESMYLVSRVYVIGAMSSLETCEVVPHSRVGDSEEAPEYICRSRDKVAVGRACPPQARVAASNITIVTRNAINARRELTLFILMLLLG